MAAGLKQLMQQFRVVLHFRMPTLYFKKFYYELLKKADVRPDAVYKAHNMRHEYYQDYSQILLDSGVKSHEELAKKVLFVVPFENYGPENGPETVLIDPAVANPDLASLVKGAPLNYAISGLAKKCGTEFDDSLRAHYEPVTLLVPSIRSQRRLAALSMHSLVKAICRLAHSRTEPNFAEGARVIYKDSRCRSQFQCIETGSFWTHFDSQKRTKRLQCNHIESLKLQQRLSTKSFEAAPLVPVTALTKDQAVTATYLQLLALNPNHAADRCTVKLDTAEFSDLEFDQEVEKLGAQSRISTFIIPNASGAGFENVPPECLHVEPCPRYLKWILSLSPNKH